MNRPPVAKPFSAVRKVVVTVEWLSMLTARASISIEWRIPEVTGSASE